MALLRSLNAIRKPKLGTRRLRIGLAVSVVTVAVVAATMAFDATWLRPLAQRYVREHAGRRIDFDRLRIVLDARLRPVVMLHNLQVENAAWAAKHPLIRAGEFDLTISWESLRGKGLIVPLLVIADGDIDLEQQADGLRNWRLSDPQDRGPGKVRIFALQAERSRMRVVRVGQNVELDLATIPLAEARSLAAHADLPLTQSLRFNGQHDDTHFKGAIDVSRVLTLRDSGVDFALDGQVSSGPSTVRITGLAHDLLQFAGLDVDLQLSSPSLNRFGESLGLRSLPALAASASARLHKDGPNWAVSGLHAQAGHSDVSGTLEFARSPDPASAATGRATLTSRRLDLRDFHLPISVRQIADSPPANPIDRHRLSRLDGEIDLKVAKLDGLPLARVSNLVDLHAHAVLHEGRVAIAPLTFAALGGTATGKVTADATRSPAELAVDLQFSHLRLDELMAVQSSGERPDGGLNLHVAMQSRGDAIPALRDNLTGDLSASLQQASLPAKMDAELALDGGHWMRSLLEPGKRVAVTCAMADLAFVAGKGRSRRLAIETEDVALSGTVAVDLPHETFDLLLTPHRKQSALLALDKSLRLSGGFRQPRFELVAGADALSSAGCASTSSR